MFEKNMRITYLLDFYGSVLDEHSRTIMKAYYEDDLSLSEIAEDEGISRQGVRHIIKKCEEQLEFLENKLGLAEFSSEVEAAGSALVKICDELYASGNTSLRLYADKISEIIKKISSK